jgi:hypothetical protein
MIRSGKTGGLRGWHPDAVIVILIRAEMPEVDALQEARLALPTLDLLVRDTPGRITH